MLGCPPEASFVDNSQLVKGWTGSVLFNWELGEGCIRAHLAERAPRRWFPAAYQSQTYKEVYATAKKRHICISVGDRLGKQF